MNLLAHPASSAEQRRVAPVAARQVANQAFARKALRRTRVRLRAKRFGAPVGIIARHNQAWTSGRAFRILDRVGEGALGEVFRARDTKVGRTVALRCCRAAFSTSLPAANASWRMRPETGLPLSSQPRHAVRRRRARGPVVSRLRFVSGETLPSKCAGRAMIRERAEIAIQLADALSEAHARDVRMRTSVQRTSSSARRAAQLSTPAWPPRGGAARAQIRRFRARRLGPPASPRTCLL